MKFSVQSLTTSSQSPKDASALIGESISPWKASGPQARLRPPKLKTLQTSDLRVKGLQDWESHINFLGSLFVSPRGDFEDWTTFAAMAILHSTQGSLAIWFLSFTAIVSRTAHQMLRELTNTKGRLQVGEFIRSARPADSFDPLHAASLRAREKDQTKILRSGEDVRILKKAMTAFATLQHVQILRLTDEADQRLLKMLEGDGSDAAPSGQPVVDLRWSPACYHATKTIAEALTSTQSSFNKFSGPMMSPQSMLAIQSNIPQTFSLLASGLTCLELHFEDGADLNTRVQELSGLLRAVFSAAKNLQAVHIGFPSRTPLDLNLEDIFHDIKWDKLRAFGVQACRLEAREIIWLVRRHSKTLRGLRLRDVLLKEDSMWKDVLQVLRTEMEQLDWVSLRRIDYSNHFDDSWEGSMEVPDDIAFGSSDSDDEDDFPSHLSDADFDDSDDGSDERSNADTDHGPNANELALSPDTPVSLRFCTCSNGSRRLSADDLGDNGHSVTYPQRKMWEKWVIGGYCPEHSS